jgi:ABC-2 type transport system permease protein/sodium transport system permease protein
LWPWAHELIKVLRQVGVSSLPESYLEQMAARMAEWRTIPPYFLVVVLGIVPAVMEELFFRGFLFSALLGEQRQAGAATATIGSAALFALFHVLVPGGLSVERLVSSLVMGLVLGWLAYASGSVVPGVLLHALHNSLLLLLAYHEPQLIRTGWLAQAQEHVPGWLLAASGMGVVVGLGWLAWLTRTRRRETPLVAKGN